MRRLLALLFTLGSTLLFSQQTKVLPNGTGSSKYVVFAWNDLGMHCLNPTYDQAVILPPYNVVHAQVVQRGNPPVIVTNGLTVAYSILGNTTSANKGKFGQFWANAYQLFGVSPAIDKGLNLVDPAISNGLAGTMVVKGTQFVVDGIPLTPINDAGVWNPYQTGIISVKDGTGAVVASTNIVVPTSDEINCSKCHGTTNAFGDILQKHDAKFNTNLQSRAPVLCASCHGSPALGQTGRGSAGTYMSEAIHASHATRGASCYDCHPGATTKCNRSLAHNDANGACTNCHGSMANVAATIKVKGRVPWGNEPQCVQCHTNVPGVDTAGGLFRNSAGHGQMACVACHNSPHAMLPSREATDAYTTRKYQGAEAAVKTIGSCGACHSSNHGKGFSGWYDEHGKSGAEAQSACNVCHTGFTNPVQANFPHQFQWNTRTATVGSGPVTNVPVVETPLPTKATGVTLTPDLPSPQPSTKVITFTAVGIGSTNYQYQFSVDGVVLQAYSTTSKFTVPAYIAATGGTHAIKVDVVTSLPPAATPDATATVNFTFTATAPGAPTILAPSGLGVSTTPTYTFNAVFGAAEYRLWRRDSATSTQYYSRWYTAAEAGVPAGTGVGSILESGVVLPVDRYTWGLQARNAAGASLLSTTLVFVTDSIPVAPTTISPTGTGNSSTPTYTFNAVSNATSYRLYRWDSATGTNYYSRWYTATEAGVPAGTGVGSITESGVTLIVGKYTWGLQAQNIAGISPTSALKTFNVGAIPAKPTPISPTGSGISSTPTYTFNAVAYADSYRIYHRNSAGTVTYSAWFTATAAGVPAGTGVGSITETGVVLPSDTYTWAVQAKNVLGTGSWSDTKSFFVGTAPVAPVPIAPVGTGISPTPTYTFNAVSNATSYRIYRWDATTKTNYYSRWYTATEAGVPTGTGVGSITEAGVVLPADRYAWGIQARNGGGTSPLSSVLTFYVP